MDIFERFRRTIRLSENELSFLEKLTPHNSWTKGIRWLMLRAGYSENKNYVD